MTEEEHDNAGGVYVGERLRAIRRQKRLSLQDVEAMSGQEVKASEPLFTIDARPFAAALAEAQANLERDRARAENSEARNKPLATTFSCMTSMVS